MDIFELIDATERGRRRERFFGPEVTPPGSPSQEQPDGGGAEQDPRRA